MLSTPDICCWTAKQTDQACYSLFTNHCWCLCLLPVPVQYSNCGRGSQTPALASEPRAHEGARRPVTFPTLPPPPHPQDLVEVLSTPGIWWTAKQTDQRIALEENGTYPLGYEETQPFEYHAGYLSVHFSARKYGVTGRELTPLQQEAVW